MQLDRATAGQALVVASMEPAGYYPCLDNPAFMGLFDLEMSYRLQARLTTESAFREGFLKPLSNSCTTTMHSTSVLYRSEHDY